MDLLHCTIMALTSEPLNAVRHGIGVAALTGAGLFAGYLLLTRTLLSGIQTVSEEPSDEAGNLTCAPAVASSKSVDKAAADAFALRAGVQRTGLQSILRASGPSGILLFSTLMGIELFAMPSLMRKAFESIREKSGIQLSAESVKGGILHGELVLRKLKIVRKNHPKSNFDLKCAEVRIRATWWTVLSWNPAIDELKLSEVSGQCELLATETPPAPGQTYNSSISDVMNAQLRQGVKIKHFKVADSRIRFTDQSIPGEVVELKVAVKKLDCSDFRTERAATDIVFRSNTEGMLDDQKFQITSTDSKTGHKTEWKATKLPVKLARAYLGGPFRWLTKGKFNVQAEQLVSPDQTRPVQLNCRLSFIEIQAGVPDGLGPTVTIGARYLVNFLNQQSRPVDLNFQVEAPRNRFDLRSVENSNDLWAQIRTAAIAALLKAGGKNLGAVADFVGAENPDEVVEKAAGLADFIVDSIQQRRQTKRELGPKPKRMSPKPPK